MVYESLTCCFFVVLVASWICDLGVHATGIYGMVLGQIWRSTCVQVTGVQRQRTPIDSRIHTVDCDISRALAVDSPEFSKAPLLPCHSVLLDCDAKKIILCRVGRRRLLQP